MDPKIRNYPNKQMNVPAGLTSNTNHEYNAGQQEGGRVVPELL
jgi:hypothetical protein